MPCYSTNHRYFAEEKTEKNAYCFSEEAFILYHASEMPLSRPLICLALASNLSIGSLPGQVLKAGSGLKSETTEVKHFQIPAADAGESLEIISAISDRPLIYLVDQVKGVRLNAVEGEMTLWEAIVRMVENTALTVSEEESSGTWIIKRRKPEVFLSKQSEVGSLQINELEPNPNMPTNSDNKKNWLSRLMTGLVVTLLTGTQSPAAAQEADQAVYELNPFTVDESENIGYLATSTLAGTRLNTQLRDVGAAITAITPEFLEDTAATDLTELLIYTVNTEAAGANGNGLGGTVLGTVLQEDDARRNPTSGTRVRGLAPLDTSRDYFLSAIPTDTYNVSRIDIVRGPNALLFGLGSPAGVSNSTLIKAQLHEDSGKIQVRAGDYGTWRLSGDFNKVILPGKLAVRLALLNESQEFQQRPAFEDDERAFVTIRTMPWKTEQHDLSFTANYEQGEITARRPRRQGPADRFTVWLAAGTPGRDSATAVGGNKLFPTDFLDSPNAQIDTSFYDRQGQFYRGPAIYWNWVLPYEQDSQAPTMAGFQGRRPGNTAANGGSLDFWGVRETNLFSTHVSGNTSLPLNRYDWLNNLAGGTTERANSDFDGVTVSADANFFNNLFGVEVGFARSTYQDDFASPFSEAVNGVSSNIFEVDINETLIDGRVNPNFGRPYMVASTREKAGRTKQESLRVTGYFDYDFRDHLDGWVGALIGQHRLTGHYSSQTLDTSEYLSRLGWVGDEAVRDLNDATITNQRREVIPIVYIGDSLKGVGPNDDFRFSFDPTFSIPKSGDVFDVVHWDRDDQAWRTDPYGVKRAYSTGSTIGSLEIDSKVGALESHWLNDTLVTIAGWRKDTADPFSSEFRPENIPAPVDEDGSVNIDDLKLYSGDSIEGEIWTYSAVAHLPKSVELPFGLDFSLHYSQSENFQPVAGEKNIFGDFITAPTGEGKDYGITVAAFENRAQFRFNWYETSILNARTNVVSQNDVNAMLNLDFQTALFWYEALAVDNGYITQGDIDYLINSIPQGVRDLVNYRTFANPDGTLTAGYDIPTGLSDVTNIAGEGFEVEATFNLTSDWRLHFNVAQTKAIQNNTAPFISEYIAQRTEVWGDPRSGITSPISELPRNPASFVHADDPEAPKSPAEYQSLAEQAIGNAYNRVDGYRNEDGGFTTFLREWRFNMLTNYAFSDTSALKGFSVGGAYRWEDEAVVGFNRKSITINQGTELEETITVPDFTSPRISPSQDHVDFWLGYRTRLTDKVDWRIQLNVRNVFESDGLIPIDYNAAGEAIGYIFGPSRSWTLSSTFSF